jgi:amino acid permease
MGTLGTIVAVVKAYCAINVLLLPRAFANGGYVLSPIAMLFACFFEALCAARLTEVAHKYGIYSYPLLMQRALGERGLWAARLFLSVAHWQFCIGQVTFTLKSLQSSIGPWTGSTPPMWVLGLAIWLVYSPLVWVRRLKFFSYAFLFAVSMIVVGVATTSAYALGDIAEQGGAGPGFVPVNEDSYFGTVGFAFFMFEGVGCLLPVMRETARPERMPAITVVALACLCTTYILFSLLCYAAWGDGLSQPVVTEMLPKGDHWVQAMKLLFCINLMFSFPITIVPTFDTLQACILGKRETISIADEEAKGAAEDGEACVLGKGDSTLAWDEGKHDGEDSVSSSTTITDEGSSSAGTP